MVSDQFQAFHRNNLLFEKCRSDASSFDLITAKHEERVSESPMFLREGVETDVIYFKEILVWVQVVFEEALEYELYNEYAYPFFTIE